MLPHALAYRRFIEGEQCGLERAADRSKRAITTSKLNISAALFYSIEISSERVVVLKKSILKD